MYLRDTAIAEDFYTIYFTNKNSFFEKTALTLNISHLLIATYIGVQRVFVREVKTREANSS